ncbi:hypothetical protein F5Y18DRAFT_436881 [Xylariaceae sp. FL1019]|nr:hypothetical protein F5Y18DRAFT_436881 [Xylariaceae sp. FL1019]
MTPAKRTRLDAISEICGCSIGRLILHFKDSLLVGESMIDIWSQFIACAKDLDRPSRFFAIYRQAASRLELSPANVVQNSVLRDDIVAATQELIQKREKNKGGVRGSKISKTQVPNLERREQQKTVTSEIATPRRETGLEIKLATSKGPDQPTNGDGGKSQDKPTATDKAITVTQSASYTLLPELTMKVEQARKVLSEDEKRLSEQVESKKRQRDAAASECQSLTQQINAAESIEWDKIQGCVDKARSYEKEINETQDRLETHRAKRRRIDALVMKGNGLRDQLREIDAEIEKEMEE